MALHMAIAQLTRSEVAKFYEFLLAIENVIIAVAKVSFSVIASIQITFNECLWNDSRCLVYTHIDLSFPMNSATLTPLSLTSSLSTTAYRPSCLNGRRPSQTTSSR